LRILADPDFMAGKFDTSFMTRFLDKPATSPDEASDADRAAVPAV
jgi:hypothetical protein